MDHFIQLPPEILEVISSHTDNTAILSLRQLSRKTASCAHDAFVARFFSNRVHLYTHFSLQNLVNISTNELFRNHVKRIELRVVKPVLRNPQSKLPKTYFSSPEIARSYEQRCVRLLADALRNFAALGPMPALSFQDYDPEDQHESPYQPYGVATMRRGSHATLRELKKGCKSLGCGLTNALGPCLTALALAQTPITTLDIGSRSQTCEDNKELSPSLDHPTLVFGVPLSDLAAPLARTTTLSLTIGLEEDVGSPQGPLDKFFEFMPALTSLTLKTWPVWDPRGHEFVRNRVGGGLEEDLFKKWLRPLRLEHFAWHGPVAMSSATLKAILRTLKPQLRSLELRDVEIYSRVGWLQTHRFLARDFELERVEFHKLAHEVDEEEWTQMPEFPEGDDRLAGYVFEGSEAVKEGLERLAVEHMPEVEGGDGGCWWRNDQPRVSNQ